MTSGDQCDRNNSFTGPLRCFFNTLLWLVLFTRSSLIGLGSGVSHSPNFRSSGSFSSLYIFIYFILFFYVLHGLNLGLSIYNAIISSQSQGVCVILLCFKLIIIIISFCIKKIVWTKLCTSYQIWWWWCCCFISFYLFCNFICWWASVKGKSVVSEFEFWLEPSLIDFT